MPIHTPMIPASGLTGQAESQSPAIAGQNAAGSQSNPTWLGRTLKNMDGSVGALSRPARQSAWFDRVLSPD
jgi:hypothetical protein